MDRIQQEKLVFNLMIRDPEKFLHHELLTSQIGFISTLVNKYHTMYGTFPAKEIVKGLVPEENPLEVTHGTVEQLYDININLYPQEFRNNVWEEWFNDRQTDFVINKIAKLYGEKAQKKISNETLRTKMIEATESWGTLQAQHKLNTCMFKWKTINEWSEIAANSPPMINLFDEFWYQGELAIIYAIPGVGKTALCYQIANSIASGKPIPGFSMTASPQKVLYFDFELQTTQLNGRVNPEIKNPNFIRVVQDDDKLLPDNMEFSAWLMRSLETAIMETEAKVMIFDNISWMSGEMNDPKTAAIVMKQLSQLKRKYGMSILAVAHTPKRSPWQEIQLFDIAGAAQISNMADSCFSIGLVRGDKEMRYLKQTKVRSSALKYDSSNVAVTRLSNTEGVLHHTLSITSFESKLIGEGESWREQAVTEFKGRGLSQQEIAGKTGLSQATVSRILQDDAEKSRTEESITKLKNNQIF